MSKYGLLYQGSKNKIADKIIDLLPPADNFYDLFAGGSAKSASRISEVCKNKYKTAFQMRWKWYDN